MNQELLKQSVAAGELGKVVGAAGEMVIGEGGLLIPKSSLPRRVWTWDQWKLIRRVVKFFAQEDIVMVLQCRGCQTILAPQRTADGRAMELNCKCKVREIRPNA